MENNNQDMLNVEVVIATYKNELASKMDEIIILKSKLVTTQKLLTESVAQSKELIAQLKHAKEKIEELEAQDCCESEDIEE